MWDWVEWPLAVIIERLTSTVAIRESVGGWPAYLVNGVYLSILFFILLFGLHRWFLVWLYYRHRRNMPRWDRCFRELPRVTVQLPMYNERYVARRIIQAAAAIDYPRDKLQIQVLDDSTDQTCQIASAVVAELQSVGHDIEYLHRSDRTGFKAGALEAGLRSATGEFVMVFDADFVPPSGILRNMIHYFTDENVGMVQARWDHINRNQSLLTKTQAILLDAHFVIEHAARNTTGRFMNFNGTAGIWRRRAIEQAGGWQHDTLTEDMDLSYRAQLEGWRFIYLPHVVAPAELPPEVQGFKQQQFRWTKGTIQTAQKILPRLLKSPLSWKIKLEACFHLLNPFAYLLMSILVLLFLPMCIWQADVRQAGLLLSLMVGGGLIFLATGSAAVFYMCSQREIFSRWSNKVAFIPLLMGVGVGIALNNSVAILEALFGKRSDFERTPKFGVEANQDRDIWLPRATNLIRKSFVLPAVEFLYGIYCVLCLFLFSGEGVGWLLFCPFLAIFAFGYFYVGTLSLYAMYIGAQKASPAKAMTSSVAG